MPTDLKCPHCDLRISVGGFFTGLRDGFSGATLTPCGACGTQHLVRHGLRSVGPEHLEIQRVVVDSFEPSALHRVVVRVQKLHKPKPSLSEALAIARNVPFTLVESITVEQALKLIAELRQISVQARAETTDRTSNPFFGLAQPDRIEYHPRPQHGDNSLPWLVAAEAAPKEAENMRCMVCQSEGVMIQTVQDALTCPACRQANLTDIGYWLT